MGDKKQLLINMFAVLITFSVQAGINFILIPHITAQLGAEADGFVTLSNSLVNYISIITIAITSMTSRFISIALFRNNLCEAKSYYSSTLITLFICAFIIAAPSIICIYSIEMILKISPDLVSDVKLLTTFVLANFSISLMSSNLTIGFYVKNKLYIGSMINATGYAMRALIMVAHFAFLPTNVSIVGFTVFISISFMQFCYLSWKKKLLPEVKFSLTDVQPYRAFEVARSGIWNSISQLGTTLSTGVDMIVCNIF